MKKIFFLFIIFSSFVQAQIITIPDANFKAKLIQADVTNTIAYSGGIPVKIDTNLDGDIQQAEAVLIDSLNVFNAGIFDLTGIQSFSNVKTLRCDSNNINGNLDLMSLTQLTTLQCYSNQISGINVSNSPNLKSIIAYNNLLSSIDLSQNNLIEQLSLSSNNLTELLVDNLIELKYLDCGGNQFETLNCNNNSNLEGLYIQSPFLKYLFIKNGVDESTTMDTGSWVELFCCSPNLEYVCCDESQFDSVMAMIQQLNLVNCEVNTYCNFTPGGNYNTITGTVHYDTTNNGCDETDFTVPYFRLMVDLNAVSTNSSVFTNLEGNYHFYTTNEGNYSFIPSIENPSFFTINPQPGIAIIEEIDNSTTTLDFCFTANGIHPDLEIVVAPAIPARPGFEAKYLIVYKNKGNQIMSQEYGVNFFYNQQLMDYVSSSVVPSSQVSGGLQWSFENLMPFESRSIVVTMAINPPTDTENPVNIGDELIFTSIILPQAGDEIVQDNTFVFNQTVIGPYDPNDITCLQGDVVSPSEIGNYLHYLIRFENTGNAPAENVVVKVEIDPAQFDINSLQMLSTSHNADIRMSGNKLEFIFQNIQLDSGGHGNILLKMKTKPTLQVGDMVEKKANIYFDYNFPIQTNEAETLFQALSVVNPVLDNLISIYPNPVKDIVNITIKDNSTIKTIELYDIQGRLLQTQLVNDINSELNLAERANGMYFIKINTDKGSKVEKLMKE